MHIFLARVAGLTYMRCSKARNLTTTEKSEQKIPSTE